MNDLFTVHVRLALCKYYTILLQCSHFKPSEIDDITTQAKANITYCFGFVSFNDFKRGDNPLFGFFINLKNPELATSTGNL